MSLVTQALRKKRQEERHGIHLPQASPAPLPVPTTLPVKMARSKPRQPQGVARPTRPAPVTKVSPQSTPLPALKPKTVLPQTASSSPLPQRKTPAPVPLRRPATMAPVAHQRPESASNDEAGEAPQSATPEQTETIDPIELKAVQTTEASSVATSNPEDGLSDATTMAPDPSLEREPALPTPRKSNRPDPALEESEPGLIHTTAATLTQAPFPAFAEDRPGFWRRHGGPIATGVISGAMGILVTLGLFLYFWGSPIPTFEVIPTPVTQGGDQFGVENDFAEAENTSPHSAAMATVDASTPAVPAENAPPEQPAEPAMRYAGFSNLVTIGPKGTPQTIANPTEAQVKAHVEAIRAQRQQFQSETEAVQSPAPSAVTRVTPEPLPRRGIPDPGVVASSPMAPAQIQFILELHIEGIRLNPRNAAQSKVFFGNRVYRPGDTIAENGLIISRVLKNAVYFADTKGNEFRKPVFLE